MEPHPLDPLSPSEISLVCHSIFCNIILKLTTKKAAKLVKNAFPKNEVTFRAITLAEPPKALLVPYLRGEKASRSPAALPRIAFIQYYLDHASSFQQIEADLKTNELFNKKSLEGKHSYTDSIEMQKSEIACLANKVVQAEIKALDLPEEAVVCVEAWTYAPDGIEDMKQRIIMVSHLKHSKSRFLELMFE